MPLNEKISDTTISLYLPPDVMNEAQEIAKEERRSVPEVLLKALRQYLANRTHSAVRKQPRRVIKKKKNDR